MLAMTPRQTPAVSAVHYRRSWRGASNTARLVLLAMIQLPAAARLTGYPAKFAHPRCRYTPPTLKFVGFFRLLYQSRRSLVSGASGVCWSRLRSK
ncbi:hypothetical protein KCP69_05600 [Salmonella enterica subsp. enterica]|nr:hypothetical protein KCP69_05600 [Salmonella enterica subsp. enterica]